jgi:signal transduction histidine kinase
VQVRLASDEGQVQVSVRDNGIGFDVDAPRSSAHGLLGMRYRLETEGGTLRMTSASGQGTLIEAHLPEST